MNDREEPERVAYRAESSYEIPASPEEVWEAIATAEGISSWMVPARLEPRVGGEVSFDLGEFVSTGTVTDYAPHTRFAYEEPWPVPERTEDIPPGMLEWFARLGVPLSRVREDLSRATPVATEFFIQTASGGSCVVRVVTSAYGSGADWEHEFFSEMVASTAPIWDRLAARFAEAVPQ